MMCTERRPWAAIQRRRDLPSRRARAVQHDSLDAGTQISEDRLGSGDGGIDEKDFGAGGGSQRVNDS